MTNWNVITEYVASVAGFLSSMTIILGVFYKWVWKPYAKKKDEREKQWQKTMLDIATGQISPIADQLGVIEKQNKRHDEVDRKLQKIADQNVAIINEMRQEFKDHNYHSNERDKLIQQNAQILKQHDERLASHNERILILETVNRIPSTDYNLKKEKGEKDETE